MAEAKPTENAPKRSKRGDLEVLTALDTAKTQLYHFKAIVIAGMGFFTDAYDLFCISTVTKLLGRIYYYDEKRRPDKPGVMPPGPLLAVTGVALFGTLAGQLVFGKMGDMLGRKRVYGFTLVLMVVSSIGSSLTFGKGRLAVIITLCIFRFLLGFGIGGDYPLSATIMSEYANTRTRGGFIAAVFAMQGVGILVAGLVAMIVSKIFLYGHHIPAFADSKDIEKAHVLSKPDSADYVWRTVFAFGAIPAVMTLYWRMKMPETARYTALVEGNTRQAAADMATVLEVDFEEEETKADVKQFEHPQFGLWSREFARRHGLHLLGTTMCWFLLDIAFYSQTFFQKDVLRSVGWIRDANELNAISEVYDIAKAQVQLALVSTVPGYFFTVLLIDRIGRFKIQLLGFFFMTVFMLAAAGPYDILKKHKCPHDPSKQCGNVPAFLFLYAGTFFFANFGPNSTTFIVPAEIFPARLRSTCHGISAAAGKVGAIVGSFGFAFMAEPPRGTDLGFPRGLGTRKALFALSAVNFLGLLFTFLVPETNQKTLEDLSRENEEVAAVVPPSRELSEMSTGFQRKKFGPMEESP